MASVVSSPRSENTAHKTASLPTKYLFFLVFLLSTCTIFHANVAAFQPRTFSTKRTPLHISPRSKSVVSPRLSSDSSLNDVSTNEVESPLLHSEITKLFRILRDTTILYDPSRGTCCRNKCSGCTYLDANGNFMYDEYTATDSNNKNGGGTEEDDVGGWLAPYVRVDFGDIVHTSRWSEILFSSSNNTELDKNRLGSVLARQADNGVFYPLALKALWATLSPSAGYPRLTLTEIVRAIKGTEGASYEMGGAVDYVSFRKAMIEAAVAAARISSNADDVDGDSGGELVDYDALSKEELLTLVEERGMKTTFPKMKRIIIEELRFFDANGRQGKRHPVKNTLS